MDEGQLLGVPEVARLLRLHDETVRRLAREGRLPGFKAGRSWRFDRGDLADWRAGQRAARARPRILVADDSDAVRDVLRVILEEEGHDVVVAATGTGARAAIRRQLPDLAILDLGMPEGSGVEVLSEIRRRDPDLPVIVITGYSDSALMQKALRHSPLLVMAKPVDPEKLLRAVASALGVRQ